MPPKDCDGGNASCEPVSVSQQAAEVVVSEESLLVASPSRRMRKMPSRRARSKSRSRRPKKYAVSPEEKLARESLATSGDIRSTTKCSMHMPVPGSPRREMTSSAKSLAKREAEFDSPRRINVREILARNTPSPIKKQQQHRVIKSDYGVSNRDKSLKKEMMPDLNDFVPPPIDDFDDVFDDSNTHKNAAKRSYDDDGFGGFDNPFDDPFAKINLPAPPLASPVGSPLHTTTKGGPQRTLLQPSKRDHTSRRSRSVARSIKVEEDIASALVEPLTLSKPMKKRVSRVSKGLDSPRRKIKTLDRSALEDMMNNNNNSIISNSINKESSLRSKSRTSLSRRSDHGGGSQRRSRSVARSRLDPDAPSSPSRRSKSRVSLKALGIDSPTRRNDKEGCDGTVQTAPVVSSFTKAPSSRTMLSAPPMSPDDSSPKRSSPRVRVRQKISPVDAAALLESCGGGSPVVGGKNQRIKLTSPPTSPTKLSAAEPPLTPGRFRRKPKVGAASPGRRSIRVSSSKNDALSTKFPTELMTSPEQRERRRLSIDGAPRNVVRVAVRMRRASTTDAR